MNEEKQYKTPIYCRKASNAYYNRNTEKMKEKNKIYYEENCDKIRIKRREYYFKRKEELNQKKADLFRIELQKK